MPISISEQLVSYIKQLGIRHVFGIPGGHNAPLYAALTRAEAQGGPKNIMSRHETGAAFMADGYARNTGLLGVCLATTGPGATNLLTGVASAYADHIPLLVITAQTMLSHFAWGAFQECSPDSIDSLAMFEHCTRYNTLISHPNQFDVKLYTALKHALTGARGPVHISIPADLLRVEYTPLNDTLPPSITTLQNTFDQQAVTTLWQRIQTCQTQGQQVVLWVGQDSQGAAEAIQKLAEYLNAPIISSQGGKTRVNAFHPLYRGVFGFAGHVSARATVAEPKVGLIIALGCTLGHWATSAWDALVLNEKLVHVHPDYHYFGRSTMAQLQVQGDILTVVNALLAHAHADNLTAHSVSIPLPNTAIPTQIEVQQPEAVLPATQDNRIHPVRLLACLQQQLPADSRYFIDVGNALAWSIHYCFPTQAERYHLSVGTAAMGWGIGAAIGNAFADASAPTVCLTGDGCFLMHGNELSVAIEHQLPILFIILNDQAYGMVRHRYQQVGTAPMAFALPVIDFAAMAQAMGATAFRLDAAEALENVDFIQMLTLLNAGPVVLDLQIDVAIEPPLGMF